MPPAIDVSTHSRPKAAADINPVHGDTVTVSTHSRPKAAGYVDHLVRRLRCFNTQPPEGGWLSQIPKWLYRHVSTHSRPKAADLSELLPANRHKFQHTAARRRLIGQGSLVRYMIVSTHSRPKAAGERMCPACMDGRGFNTQPPEGGWLFNRFFHRFRRRFQHTAARRRLSTTRVPVPNSHFCFNTQPPEGGCCYPSGLRTKSCRFNTQPPEGGCDLLWLGLIKQCVSTHSRPKAAARFLSNRQARLCFNTQPPEGG